MDRQASMAIRTTPLLGRSRVSLTSLPYIPPTAGSAARATDTEVMRRGAKRVQPQATFQTTASRLEWQWATSQHFHLAMHCQVLELETIPPKKLLLFYYNCLLFNNLLMISKIYWWFLLVPILCLMIFRWFHIYFIDFYKISYILGCFLLISLIS